MDHLEYTPLRHQKTWMCTSDLNILKNLIHRSLGSRSYVIKNYSPGSQTRNSRIFRMFFLH